jgi:hypothetical protein
VIDINQAAISLVNDLVSMVMTILKYHAMQVKELLHSDAAVYCEILNSLKLEVIYFKLTSGTCIVTITHTFVLIWWFLFGIAYQTMWIWFLYYTALGKN